MVVSVGFFTSTIEAGRLCFSFGCESLIGPFHKRLWNKDSVQAVGETDNIPFVLFYTSVAMQHNVHLYQSHYTFRQLRQVAALCETEVIKVQVVTGNDNRYGLCTFVKVPFVQADIYKLIGNRFKNISVEMRIPACSIPSPADTLKRVGVKRLHYV